MVYEPQHFSVKFESSCQDLKELFLRYESLLSKSPNSLLSYSAACSFFMALFDATEQSQKCAQTRQLMESFAIDKSIIATHRKAILECQNSLEEMLEMKELLKEALHTMREFERIFAASH